jgi:hypothetical protein
MRYEILAEQIAFAENLLLDPRSPTTVGLRQSILKNLQTLVAKPRWRCEQRLKERIKQALSTAYRPWDGEWQTKDKGILTLTQKTDRVSGTFDDGAVIAVIKGRSLLGQWKAKTGPIMEFKCTLADDDGSVAIELSSKPGGPVRYTGKRVEPK